VFNLLAWIWNGVDTPSNYAQGTALSSATLDTLIENVLDYSPNVRGIFGTRRALYPIYNFSGFREYTVTGGSTPTAFDIPEVLLERFRTNRVAAYNGIPLIEIPQTYQMMAPTLTTKMVPDEYVVIVGMEAGEIKLFNGFETQDYTDFTVQPADYVVHGWREYAMTIDKPESIAVFRKI
jgi:hypothetical protein